MKRNHNYYHKAYIDTQIEHDKDKRIKSLYPKWFIFLYGIFCIYLVIPIGDIPMLGLSLSAPMFFLLAVHVVLKPPAPWFKKYEKWFFMAAFIWVGIASSFFATEIIGSFSNFNISGLSILIHYAYWMLVFVIITYLCSRKMFLQLTIKLLGWGVLIVAVLRWVEAIVFGRMGFWSGTQLFTQNMYGFLFSAFSPFAFAGILEKESKSRFVKILGVILIWSAAAINGSRGSWVAMAIGIMFLLLLLLLSKPKKFVGMVIAIILIFSATGILIQSNQAINGVFLERFQTIETLEEDKSYMSRQFLNQKSLILFQESPLFGIGQSRYHEVSVMADLPYVLRGSSVARLNQKTAHNAYLGFLAENGLAGAIPLGILLLYLSINGGVSVINCIKMDQYWALYPYVAFFQMSIHFWVLAGLTGTSTWFVYGLVGGVIVLANKLKSYNPPMIS